MYDYTHRTEHTTKPEIVGRKRRSTMLEKFRKFIRDEEGQSAVEYALVIGIIIAGLATAYLALSGTITDLVNRATDTVSNVSNQIP